MNENINWDEKSRFEEEPQIFTENKNGSDTLEQDVYCTNTQCFILNPIETVQKLFSKMDENTKWSFHDLKNKFYECFLENDRHSVRIGSYMNETDVNKRILKIAFWDRKLKEEMVLSALEKRGSPFEDAINDLIGYIKNNYTQT